jgi:hypothetical protein
LKSTPSKLNGFWQAAVTAAPTVAEAEGAADVGGGYLSYLHNSPYRCNTINWQAYAKHLSVLWKRQNT